MSYELKLIRTSSPSNKINKDISNAVYGRAINLKTLPKDINNLEIDVFDYTISQLTLVNYAYIQTLNLYYFVKILPTNIGNNHNILHLELDPLMTYKSQILNLDCIIKRNTSKYNLYVEDEELQTLKKTQIQTKAFNHTFIPYSSTVITLVGSSYD